MGHRGLFWWLWWLKTMTIKIASFTVLGNYIDPILANFYSKLMTQKPSICQFAEDYYILLFSIVLFCELSCELMISICYFWLIRSGWRQRDSILELRQRFRDTELCTLAALWHNIGAIEWVPCKLDIIDSIILI